MKTIIVLMRNYYKKLRCLPCRFEEWEPWFWKHKIINKLAPVCLHDLVHMKNSKYSFRYNGILEIPQIKSTRYGKKKISDLLHLHCGTASQIISGLKIAFLNWRVFCSPRMGPNVAVLHVDDNVDDNNFASGLLIYFFF